MSVRVCAVMQPTYLPWLGYFDLIDAADVFVFLDNVQFEKQSWQQRNRVRTANGLELLTVPVLRTGRFGQTIADVRLSGRGFAENHLKTIRQNYGRCPHFAAYFPGFEAALVQGADTGALFALNTGLIRWFCGAFRIETPLEVSSSLGAQGKRSALLVDLCARVQAREYLSPAGAQGYLAEERELFDAAGVCVVLQAYEHPEYRQARAPFVPFASALDLLFNEGPESLPILRTGRRPPQPLG